MHSGRSWAFRDRRTASAALGMTGSAGPAAWSAAVLSHLVAGELTRTARQQPADGRTPPSPALPRLAAAVPGPMTEARLTQRRSSGSEPEGLPGITAVPVARDGVARAASSMPPPVPVSPPRGGRPPGSGAGACRSRAGYAVLTGQIPPTNRQRMIKRPDRRPGDQASDLHLLVAGAGFEPATSGL